MPKQKWVMIKSGTVIRGNTWDTKGKTHTFSELDTRLRYLVEYDCTFEETPNGGLKYDWRLTYQGRWWSFENSKTAFTEVKIPALKKEFVSLAVKGSEWEFERDWTFNGWIDDGLTEYTIPAGTQVKIKDNKMRLAWYSPQERCIVAEPAPGLEIFETGSYTGGRDIKGAFIPAREASGYLKLITPGKTKTYWKMEDAEGKPFVDKRFATLANLKSSLRVRFNLVKDNTNGPDEYVPDWVTYDDYDRPDTSKGVFAVEYDHATKQEIKREDMSKFLVISFLKS